jgi:hypothetical protein
MREPLFITAIGRKGVGKTVETNKLIQRYISGNPSKGVKPRRVLVIDVNDEYTHLKGISINDVRRFSVHPKIEARRIRPFVIEGRNSREMKLDEIAEALTRALDDFRGGLLVVEDIARYVSPSLKNDLVGQICTTRHREADLMLHYQTIGRIATPQIYGNINAIRFHKCDDSVRRHESKDLAESTMLYIAEAMVNAKYSAGDIRFFCYVNKDTLKINGNFSEQDFRQGVDDYLSKNYNIIKSELNQIDLNTGEKKHQNHKEVIDMYRKYYFEQYYGN